MDCGTEGKINIGGNMKYNILINIDHIRNLRVTGNIYIEDAKFDINNFNIEGTLNFDFRIRPEMSELYRRFNQLRSPTSTETDKGEKSKEILQLIANEERPIYEKEVFEYLKNNLDKQVNLFQMLDDGLILKEDTENNYLSRNNIAIHYNKCNTHLNYSLNEHTEHSKGHIYIDIKDLPFGLSSRRYKLHIKVKKEYSLEALNELLKNTDFNNYIIVIKLTPIDYGKTDIKKYLGLLQYLGEDDNTRDSITSNVEDFFSAGSANIVIYPRKDKDEDEDESDWAVDVEEMLSSFRNYWIQVEQEHPHWKIDYNYLKYNIRITDTLYFAYGASTGHRELCHEDKIREKCNYAGDEYTEPQVLTRYKTKFCNDGKPLPQYNGKPIDTCLKENFNIKDYATLCENGETSFSQTFGIKGGKDFPLLDICKTIHTEPLSERRRMGWHEDNEEDRQWWVENYARGGGKKTKKSRESKRRKSKRRKSKHRRSKRRRKTHRRSK
jgi:hypothetical protein